MRAPGLNAPSRPYRSTESTLAPALSPPPVTMALPSGSSTADAPLRTPARVPVDTQVPVCTSGMDPRKCPAEIAATIKAARRVAADVNDRRLRPDEEC